LNAGKPHTINSLFWTKKNNCDLSSKTLREQLTKEWQDYLLDNFLDAKVINMEIVDGIRVDKQKSKEENNYEGTKSIVTINKGEKDGIKVGMKFYVKNKEDYGICRLEVWYVTENTSVMQSIHYTPAQLKIGTELTTKSDKEFLLQLFKERYSKKKE
jgi:hypothetical protein